MAESWSVEETLVLIEKYREQGVLWDSGNKNHFNKILRNDAWNDLATQLRKPADACKKKITCLLSALRREKRKMKKCMGTGKGAEEVYCSTWFAFESLKFIWDKNQPRESLNTINNEQQTNLYTNEEESLVNGLEEESPAPSASNSVESRPPPKKAKKRRKEDKILDTAFQLLTSCAEKAVDVSDECSDFGNFVAKKLRDYDRVKRSKAMYEIMGIFLNIDLSIGSTNVHNQNQ